MAKMEMDDVAEKLQGHESDDGGVAVAKAPAQVIIKREKTRRELRIEQGMTKGERIAAAIEDAKREGTSIYSEGPVERTATGPDDIVLVQSNVNIPLTAIHRLGVPQKKELLNRMGGGRIERGKTFRCSTALAKELKMFHAVDRNGKLIPWVSDGRESL